MAGVGEGSSWEAQPRHWAADPLPLVLLPRAEPQESWGATRHPLCPETALAWSSERVSCLFPLGDRKGRAVCWQQ